MLGIFLIPAQGVNFNLHYETKNSNDSDSYLIIKVDDVGDNLLLWKWFYNSIQSDPRLNVDLGVIGAKLHSNPEHEEYFRNYIINNQQFGIFNHGWDHEMPEFENRSYDYMYRHIAYWDYYMKTTFNYSPNVKVLGAPGNEIGNRSDCSLDLYTILAQLGYKLVFFSTCAETPQTGQVGGDLTYIRFENDQLKPRTLNEIINDFNTVKASKYVFTQIHPALNWNASYLLNLLNKVLDMTHRKTLHIQDYYNKIFLKNYPNYFLNEPNDFLNTRKDIQLVNITSNDYKNALKISEFTLVNNALITMSYSVISGLIQISLVQNGHIFDIKLKLLFGITVLLIIEFISNKLGKKRFYSSYN